MKVTLALNAFSFQLHEGFANDTEVTGMVKAYIDEVGGHLEIHEAMRNLSAKSDQTNDTRFARPCGRPSICRGARDDRRNGGIFRSQIFSGFHGALIIHGALYIYKFICHILAVWAHMVL